MPRDGLQQYAPPPGTQGIPNYTVESARYNAFVADITADQNNPRPIVAGGTGATNPADAQMNLHGDLAYQVVTNFDIQVFVSGSFYCGTTTTAAPTANAFIGICYSADPAVVPPAVPANANMFLEARDVTTGLKYVRQKVAGTWINSGAWKQQAGSVADLDAAYVNVAGDVMSGPLTIGGGAFVGNGGWPFVAHLATNVNFAALNNAGAAYVGSFTDAGGVAPLTLVGSVINANEPVRITDTTPSSSPTTGALTIAGGVGVGGNLAMGGNFNVTGTFTVNINDNAVSNHALVTNGQVGTLVPSSLMMDVSVGVGRLMAFGASPAAYGSAAGWVLSSDASLVKTVWQMNSTGFTIPLTTVSTTPTTGALTVGGGVGIGGDTYTQGSIVVGGTIVGNNQMQCPGYRCRAGVGGAYGSNYFDISYAGGVPVNLWIDSTNMGVITVTSDYRIKKDVIDLPGMWDTVKALRPIKYTQAQFTPPSHIKYIAEETLKARKEAEDNPEAEPREVNTGPLFLADDIERWGFIAHELQATLVPSAASGTKDAPDTIQSPNPFTVIAALTKALQEAMARIEALEAR